MRYDGANLRRLGVCVVWVNSTLRTINGAAPVVDLAIRIWLAQLFWVSGVAGVLDWRAALTQTPGLAAALSMHPDQLALALTALRLALSPLLLVGLATRLAGTPIFLLSLAAYRANPGQDAPLLWALLGGWYLLVGPGPISLDHVIARGIYRSALPLAPVAGWFGHSASRPCSCPVPSRHGRFSRWLRARRAFGRGPGDTRRRIAAACGNGRGDNARRLE